MQRKALGILGLLALILVAIGFGYWDMLNSEKLRVAQENAAPLNVVDDAVVGAGDASTAEAEPAEAPQLAPAQSAAGTNPPVAGDNAAGQNATGPEAAKLGSAPASPSQAASSQTANVSADIESQASDAAGTVPNFDILRVEPSGETVVAGNAKPGATVALMDGGKKIGEVKANVEGQFALALDAPLSPGEHSIALQATDGQGQATASRQTAIVSVPQDAKSGQVLAMIDSPDAPSRIVEMPKAEGTAESQMTEAAADAPKNVAKAETDGQAEETQMAMAEAAPGSDRIASGKSGRATADSAGSSAGVQSATGDASTVEPASEEAASGKAGAPAPDGDRVALATPDAGTAPAAGPVAEADGATANGLPSTSITANGATEQSPDAVARGATATVDGALQAAAPLLRVEAVELQGETISVAGAATSGAKVRIYVDNALVAEDKAGGDDRFLASGKAELSIGQHIVRADQIDASGEVAARAEVPFDRPEGERVAAIAPPVADAGSSGSNSTGRSDGVSNATADGIRMSAASANNAPTSKDSGSPSPDSQFAATGGADAQAPDGVAAGGTVVAETEKSTRVRPAASNSGDATRGSASSPAVMSAGNKTVADAADSAPSNKPGTDIQIASSETSSVASETTSADQIAEGGADDGKEANAGSRVGMAIGGKLPEPDLAPGAVNRQAALTPVDGRVIIRKGDTLWRISRDTYGAGRRYTVIYLANGQQIRDPDLIYPGQVFRLPTDSDKG